MCRSHYNKWRRKVGLATVQEGHEEYAFDDEHWGERHCSKCKQWLAELEFTPRAHRCKKCAGAHTRSSQQRRRMELLLPLLDGQGGVCAICPREITAATAQIDHDHRCCPAGSYCHSCVRGALCKNCNQGLGHFRDSVDDLLSGVLYLVSWEVEKRPFAAPLEGR